MLVFNEIYSKKKKITNPWHLSVNFIKMKRKNYNFMVSFIELHFIHWNF